MASVVLHIGSHKTGSTAIQTALAGNRRLLARHGLTYPDLGGSPDAHHGLLAMWNPALARFEPKGGAEAAWRGLASRHALRPGTLLLSSEEFSRAHGRRRTDYAWIREALSAFESVEVICFLRDQISFTQSAYLQVSKNKPDMADDDQPIRPWRLFLDTAVRRGVAAGLSLDYNHLYDRLLETFEPERIHLIPYARASAQPHGVVGALLERAGCDLDPARLSLDGGGRANVTGDPLSAWAAAQVSSPRRPPDALIAQARAVLDEQAPGPTTLYTQPDIRAMKARFGPANERLAARLAARDPDFALPWPRLKDTVRPDRIGAEFWLAMARRLHASR